MEALCLTGRKIQAHDAVVGSKKSSVDCKVGGRARVRLHVDTPLVRVEAVCLKSTGLAQNLNLVDVLVTSVISLARVTLGVLVGQCRAKALHHSSGGKVLTGNELKSRPLSVLLLLDNIEQFGVVDLQGNLARKSSWYGRHFKQR